MLHMWYGITILFLSHKSRTFECAFKCAIFFLSHRVMCERNSIVMPYYMCVKSMNCHRVMCERNSIVMRYHMCNAFKRMQMCDRIWCTCGTALQYCSSHTWLCDNSYSSHTCSTHNNTVPLTHDYVTDLNLHTHCVTVWCSVFQCVAVCCSVLQCVAACCSVLQCVRLYES